MTPAADTRFGTPPTLGLKDAAVQCGVSISTMRRHRYELVKLGATVSEQGRWSIPIPALIEAGLMDRRTPPDAPAGIMTPTLTPDYLDQIAQLERQLQEEILARKDEHAGRVLAEQVAAERERIIQAQAQTLRILEAGPVTRDTTDRSGAVDRDAGHNAGHQGNQGDGTVEGTITGGHAADPVTVDTGRSETAAAGVGAAKVSPASRPVRFWDRFRRVR